MSEAMEQEKGQTKGGMYQWRCMQQSASRLRASSSVSVSASASKYQWNLPAMPLCGNFDATYIYQNISEMIF